MSLAMECISFVNFLIRTYVAEAGHVHDPKILLQSAEGKIGPAGPYDHADWELQLRPLQGR